MSSMAPVETGREVGPAATTGRIVDGQHVLTVRVYFEDTDASGIVYHANYLRFMERGRTEFCRLLGVEQSAMMADERYRVFALHSCRLRFLRPARVDDRLEVVSRVVDVGAAAIDVEQTIRCAGQDVMQGAVRVALIDQTGRPRRLPPAMRDAFVRHKLARQQTDQRMDQKTES